MESTKLLTTQQAADMMGVTPSTLRGWRCAKTGPPFIRITQRSVKYAQEDLERYIAERRFTPSVRVTEVNHNAALLATARLRYPIDMKADGKFFVVTFPDVPEAITQGESKEEAMRAAKDALETALDFYFETSRGVPLPSPLKRGQEFVVLPADLSAKILRGR
jgi:predicted RNase H-like HicB family nuclease